MDVKINDYHFKNIKIADSFIDKLIGLMFVKKLKNQGGLIISDCKSIHTCFMKFKLDVIFINKEDRVIKYIENLRPWRFTSFYIKAKAVLEVPSEKNTKRNIKNGDPVEYIYV